MNWNRATFPSLKRRGGCAVKEKTQSHLSQRRRGGQIGEIFRSEGFSDLTTLYGFALSRSRFAPVRAFRASTLRFKEGNVLAQREETR
jgi:hypothetical protein